MQQLYSVFFSIFFWLACFFGMFFVVTSGMYHVMIGENVYVVLFGGFLELEA